MYIGRYMCMHVYEGAHIYWDTHANVYLLIYIILYVFIYVSTYFAFGYDTNFQKLFNTYIDSYSWYQLKLFIIIQIQ
jgi:hypothetical protein